jgi:hypothetical protein
VAGPGIGLCVVAMYAWSSAKLGVSGGWLQLLCVVQRRPVTEPWRLWFNGGLVLGALGAGLLGAGLGWHTYGDLGKTLPAVLLVPLLVVVGVLIGYGARWAGGCTSGHGLSGCAVGSRESLAVTATFFGVGVVVTLLVHLLTGGAV